MRASRFQGVDEVACACVVVWHFPPKTEDASDATFLRPPRAS